MRYTVLLKLPDYVTTNLDCFTGSPEAPNPTEAVRLAAAECTAYLPEGSIEDPSDFLTIAVFEGQHEDVKP